MRPIWNAAGIRACTLSSVEGGVEIEMFDEGPGSLDIFE